MSIVLGIDLGTSFSCVAAVREDSVVVVEDDHGRKTLPSIVHFSHTGRVVVGYDARPMIVKDPMHTVYSAKRLLGRRYSHGAVRVAQNAYLYRIAEGPNQWPVLEARGGPYTVPEVCACILQELRSRAEHFFGEKITKAVITVPANADDAQREQTRIAGRIAGLEVLRLLNEPTSAALAYALGGVRGERMVVYDFGGGTFDCSVIRWGKDSAEVLSTHGDDFLGGDDIDMAIADHIAAGFLKETGVDLKREISEWKRLLLASETAKRILSRKPSTRIHLEKVAFTNDGPVDLDIELDRDAFDSLISTFIRQSVDLTLEAVALGGLDVSDVDEVVLVGGSSRLPLVRKKVNKALNLTPLLDFDPDTVVAVGAAIEAQRAVGGRSPTIARAPQELVDVVPHSIGLATAGGGFDPVIQRNSRLPASGHRSYTTWREGQHEMRFVVLQGDSDRAVENVRLGEFIVANLPPRPAGEVEVKLLFEVSSDGLLRASARDTTTSRVHRYRVRVADSMHEK